MCFKLKKETTLQVGGAIFGIIALLHLIRFVANWPASVNNWDVPRWLSVVGFVVAGWLSYNMMRK